MAEEDTWEPKENLGNTEDLVKKFEEEYGEIGRAKKRRDYHKLHLAISPSIL